MSIRDIVQAALDDVPTEDSAPSGDWRNPFSEIRSQLATGPAGPFLDKAREILMLDSNLSDIVTGQTGCFGDLMCVIAHHIATSEEKKKQITGLISSISMPLCLLHDGEVGDKRNTRGKGLWVGLRHAERATER